MTSRVLLQKLVSRARFGTESSVARARFGASRWASCVDVARCGGGSSEWARRVWPASVFGFFAFRAILLQLLVLSPAGLLIAKQSIC